MDAAAITLRAGVPTDFAAMHALDLVCFDERFRFDLRAMQEYASEPGAVVVVAESEGKLVGFVIVAREAGVAYVSTLDVDPQIRRLGVARRLMLAAERQVAADGVDEIGLHVFVQNEAAIRFYEARGYARGRRVRSYYGRGLDAWVYAKAMRDAVGR